MRKNPGVLYYREQGQIENEIFQTPINVVDSEIKYIAHIMAYFGDIFLKYVLILYYKSFQQTIIS